MKSLEIVRQFRRSADATARLRSSERGVVAEEKKVANGKFQKAKSEQAFLKLAEYGKAGSGKTLTALLIAEGLAKRDGKRIAYVDTERGTEFYAIDIPERTVHPAAFDFDRLVTNSLMETLEAVEEIDPKTHSVVVIDSITHLWEAAQNSYTGPRTSKGGIPIQAWGSIKKPYKRLMSLLLDGNFHAIICGREGVVMDESDDGELRVSGTRMKAEGETPHEPHILARMTPQRNEDGTLVVRVFFEKDRSGILTGKMYAWPNYATIEPVINYLSGTHQGRIGSVEDAAERDITKTAEREAKAEAERVALFQQIRSAIEQAENVDQLKAAWSLTSGKKTKLGPFFEQLATIKDARKAEMIQMAEVA